MAIPSLSAQPLDPLQIFEALPDCYLILSADLVIQLVTDSYLKTTFTCREDLVGRSILEVFAGSPATQEAATIQHLAASLQQVLDTKQAHAMPVQQYDLPDPEKTGHVVQRYWKPLNTPVLDTAGNVQCIVHKVEDVTLLPRQAHQMEDLQKMGEAIGVTARQPHSLWLSEQQHAKQAMKGLQEEHLRLIEAQALGHIGSFERNYDKDFIYCSDEFYRIHGLEPQSEKMNLEKLIAFVHPDDQQAFQESIRLARTDHKPIDLKQRIVWRDGTIRHIHRKAVIFRDEQEIPLGVYGILQDITEQVEAADKLRRSESLLREAEMIGRMGSYEGDLSTFSFQFSDNMFRLLGHEPQSIKPTLDWLDSISYPEDAIRIRQIIQEAAKEKKPYTYLRRINLPDGQTRYIASQGKVICDQEGNAIKIVGTAQDITEQKLAEEEINKNKGLLQAVFEDSLHGIEVLKSMRNAESKLVDFEILSVNKASEKMMGRTDLVGKRWLEAYPGAEQTLLFQNFLQVTETGNAVQFEEEFNIAGVVGWFDISLVKLFDGVAFIYQDITARKYAEQEVQLQKALLESVFNASLNGIEVFESLRNEQGEITDFKWQLVNRQFEQYIGRKDLIGKAWVATNPGVKQNGLFNRFKWVVDEKKVLDFEHHYQDEHLNAWFRILAAPFGDGFIITWIEITNRKKAEEELKRKTILLQAIIDTAYGGMALLDPVFNQEGKLVDVIYQMMNRRHASFFSLTGEQMLGQKMLGLFPVLQGSIIWSKIVQAWETGEVVLHQDEIHDETIDGYFMFQYVRIENQILVWSLDISDLKRAEQAAHTSEAKLRHFIDALPQMAWIASPDGGSTYFNKRTYEYTGLSFEQIRDYGWHQTYDPADLVNVDKVWRQAMATGQPYTHEARMRRYDGQSRWQLGIALPVKDAEGNIDYWAGTVTDIHDRKLAEAQVLESQALLKAVIDASINGIQAFKAIRNEQQAIIDFEWILTNQLTDTFLQRNDLVGLRLSEQYPGTKKVVIFENIQRVVETGKTSHFEVWYPYDGLQHWFEFIIVKLGDGAALTFQDITERKRLEEERLQWKLKTQQQLLHGILDAEEREKKRIAESLHNGLGQILFAAKMHLDILDPSQPPMNGEQAISSWNKSYQLLVQAIGLTRTISHELTPTILETFGLQAVIEDIGKHLSTDKLKIYSQLRVQSVLEKRFQTAIYRIAQELANNIVKHAKATEAIIAVREEEKGIIIEARDNGIGFEAEKGTKKGMGLASIRDRVKLLNGYLTINSGIDQGTTITIRLPLLPSYTKA